MVEDPLAWMNEAARRSPNFGRLDKVEPLLAVYAFQAETLVYFYPNLSLTQSGKFAETLAKDLVQRLGIHLRGNTQDDRIRALAEAGVLVPDIETEFHRLRLERNEVVHEHVFEVARALRSLRICYKLGAWYHDALTGQQTTRPFVPPEEYAQEQVMPLADHVEAMRRSGDRQIQLLRSSLQVQHVLHDLKDLEARVDNLRSRQTAASDATQSRLPTIASGDRAAIRSRLRSTRPRDVAESDHDIEPFLAIAKLWNFCNVLRDHGLSAIEYTEQITYLLALKLAQERSEDDMAENEAPAGLPLDCDWKSLEAKKGSQLSEQYRMILRELGNQRGTTLGTIFADAHNAIADPAVLRSLVVDLIGKEDWIARGPDFMSEAYEVLLAKVADDSKTGGGQYFTPRALVDVMVEVMQPGPDDTITDPACGTGGFLVAAHTFIRERYPDRKPRQQEGPDHGRLWGTELVTASARLAAMNMLLHGIASSDGESPILVADALARRPKRRASLILTDPPFGNSSRIPIGDGAKTRCMTYDREDFRVVTSKQQLNFLQHTMSTLEMHGRAAIVVPDNVLFASGPGERIRKRLLDEFNLHTLLRLPTGIFPAGGVKANVMFFEKHPHQANGKPNTAKLWIYDFRTGQRFTSKRKPVRRSDLNEFVTAFRPGRPLAERVESERFRSFGYADLIARDKINLDFSWLEDPEAGADRSTAHAEVGRGIDDLRVLIREFTVIAATFDTAQEPSSDGSENESLPE